MSGMSLVLKVPLENRQVREPLEYPEPFASATFPLTRLRRGFLAA